MNRCGSSRVIINSVPTMKSVFRSLRRRSAFGPTDSTAQDSTLPVRILHVDVDLDLLELIMRHYERGHCQVDQIRSTETQGLVVLSDQRRYGMASGSERKPAT
jgi:hypothetical protein